jgi:hypothetical protein
MIINKMKCKLLSTAAVFLSLTLLASLSFGLANISGFLRR